MKAPTLMSIREIKHDIFENFPEAAPLIASIKQKKELQNLLTDLRFANRSTSYSIYTNLRQQDDMDIEQQINTNYNSGARRNRTQYSLDQDAMDIQQSYQQKLARQMRERQQIQQRNRRARAREERAEALKREEQRLARQARQRERAEAKRREEQRLARQARQRERAEAKRREEQRLARQARQRERAEAIRREEQRLARQEAQKLAKAAREERQRKMKQQASRKNTTSSTTTTGKKPRLTQQQIRQIEKVVPGNFKLGAKTIQQLSDKNLKDKSVELTAKMKDVYIRKRPEIKVPTTTLLHAVNAEIVKRKL